MRVYGVEDSGGKASADAFKMFISLLVEHGGENGLEQWAQPTFYPLIQAAYAECRTVKCALMLYNCDELYAHIILPWC